MKLTISGGLGAGGAAEPYAVSTANALVYGVSFNLIVLEVWLTNFSSLPSFVF